MLLRRRNSLRALAIAAASTALLAGGAPAWAGAGGGGGGAGRAASGGTWQQAAPVVGLPALNAGGGANALQVSCSSAGNCAVGGFYRDKAHDDQAFVVSEEGGRWARAIEVPGTAALNTGEGAATTSVVLPGRGRLRGRRYLPDPLQGPRAVRGQ